MGWRTLYIERPGKLSLSHNRLKFICDNPEDEFELPVEDLNVVVISSDRLSLSNRLLSALSESGTVIFFCNTSHIPSGILMPYFGHCQPLVAIQKQISASQPFQKRIWQKIIQSKIKNQAGVLNKFHKNSSSLATLANKVKSGDSTNIEAITAKKYWKMLFENFKRSDKSDIRNSALNYGYSILRGVLARSISATGLIPAIGIHHRNKLNAFNLADDFLEPFRPFVDSEVKVMEKHGEIKNQEKLNRNSRLKLIDILHHDCQLADIRVSISSACKQLPLLYLQAIDNNDKNLLELPGWI